MAEAYALEAVGGGAAGDDEGAGGAVEAEVVVGAAADRGVFGGEFPVGGGRGVRAAGAEAVAEGLPVGGAELEAVVDQEDVQGDRRDLVREAVVVAGRGGSAAQRQVDQGARGAGGQGPERREAAQPVEVGVHVEQVVAVEEDEPPGAVGGPDHPVLGRPGTDMMNRHPLLHEFGL
ncbi:hypothetical protein [Kitasatospora cheerisanensis]|uniref:hypothetical protein n=1 Tax=Kitasatospora cheerisanensis TaxID=81942 RepID=UPI00056C107D|nr:hypothetical protein [Kitasatospora cheerisanensis]